MKKIVCTISYAIWCLAVVLVPLLSYAPTEGVGGVGDQSGVPSQNTNVNQSNSILSQIQGMEDEIKSLAQSIADAIKEIQQDTDELKQLKNDLESQKHNGSSQKNDVYYKWKAELQNKVTVKEHEIGTQKVRIRKLQKQLSDLQHKLTDLRKADGESLEKVLPSHVRKP